MTRHLKRLYEDVLQGERTYLYDRHPWAGFYGSTDPICAAWQAMLFAAHFHGRAGIDLRRLEDMVAEAGDPECAYQFARRVPGADVPRLRSIVEATFRPELVRRFDRHVPAVSSGRGKKR